VVNVICHVVFMLLVSHYLEDGTYLGSPLYINGFTFLAERSL
jgi:hypothetical protein